MIPADDFGGSGPLLHFAHANGYPPAAYAPLVGYLTRHHHVLAMLGRPLWPPSKNTTSNGLRDWQPLADDLIKFCDERGLSNVIGAGHSLGSVITLLAAARRPDLFRALVAIDPVLLSRRRSLAWGIAKRAGMARWVHPLIGRTLRRQQVFADPEAMFAAYRKKSIFARLDDNALRTYVDALARSLAGGGVELAYAPEWEVRIYATAPHDLWASLPLIRCPLLVIYGCESDTFLSQTLVEMKQILPAATYCGIPDAGHLVPLERPKEVAESILAFTTSL
jgi:pimeloyl-ACP methyl ester carboxylesterase